MEPLMSYDGYMMLQDDRQSRDLLSDYFKDKGYTIASPQSGNNSEVATLNGEDKNDHKQQ